MISRPSLLCSAVLLFVVGAPVTRLSAQCSTQWLPGQGVPGTDGPVAATTMWDPDGAGPLQSVLVVAGWFQIVGSVFARNIAAYDPVAGVWSALGTGMNGGVAALTTLPNGDLVAGGGFTSAGGVSASSIARWNGTSWSALGTGVNGQVNALTTRVSGDLVAGGQFTIAGGFVSAYVAQLTTTCPASTTSFGTGCTGSAGPNLLTATSLPWTGSTFRSVATGMPGNALVLSVLGLATVSIPLPMILPQGVPGCSLFVSPDLLEVYIPTAGAVQTQFVIPNTVVLAGQVLHHQVVPLELGAPGITALTSTNALSLTIGSF